MTLDEETVRCRNANSETPDWKCRPSASAVELTGDDLRAIYAALDEIDIVGERYNAQAQARINR
jgi:hypothetical protein